MQNAELLHVACGGNLTKSQVTDEQSPDMCILLMWYDLWILFINHVIICQLIIIINIIRQKSINHDFVH